MKKLYVLLAAFMLTGAVSAQVWNFSSTSFSGLGTIASTTTVDGLTIYSDGTNGAVIVDANSKLFEGVDYTHRLKLGGTGNWADDNTPNYRVLAFPVTGNSKITIICMTSSSSSERSLSVTAGNKTNVIGTASAPAAVPPATSALLTKSEIDYKGDATTIYVFSPSSGVNIYSISVTTGLKSGISDEIGSSNVTLVEYFSISGAKVSNEFESLAPGIYIQKSTYDNGTVKSVKINKEK